MKKLISTVAAATLAFGGMATLAGCGSSNSGLSNLTDVTFMNYWTPDTNHIGVYIAKDKGYYEAEGLNVDIVGVSSSGGEQAVSSSVADFALSTLTNMAQYDAAGGDLEMVMQVQQEPSAIWCALASNSAIKSPKDFDGKTFATFGSSESDAVVRKMIQSDGGKGEFDKVTVGTSTLQALSSGRADFGGFYSTWEGVQAEMEGPALNCFTEPDYGVPGNADSIGVITSAKTVSDDPELVEKFVAATKKGYEFAYANPATAAQMLVRLAPEADLDVDMVTKSMETIVEGAYWGSPQEISDGSFQLGTIDVDGVQKYLDFLADAGAFTDADGNELSSAPEVSKISTSEFVQKAASSGQSSASASN